MARPITIKALRGARRGAGAAASRRAHRRGVRRAAAAAACRCCCCCFRRRRRRAGEGRASRSSTRTATLGSCSRSPRRPRPRCGSPTASSIIAFKQPVDVSVDRIPMQARGLCERGAARSGRQRGAPRARPQGHRQHDGGGREAVRRSAARGLDRPAARACRRRWSRNWRGVRARPRRRRGRSSEVAQQRALPPVRVRVGVQPTFTRYTFALPALIAVSTERADDKMTLTFEAPLQLRSRRRAGRAAADRLGGRRASRRGQSASVRFDFIGKVDVRTFREDNNYFVDCRPDRAARWRQRMSPQQIRLARGAAGGEAARRRAPPPPRREGRAPRLPRRQAGTCRQAGRGRRAARRRSREARRASRAPSRRGQAVRARPPTDSGARDRGRRDAGAPVRPLRRRSWSTCAARATRCA